MTGDQPGVSLGDLRGLVVDDLARLDKGSDHGCASTQVLSFCSRRSDRLRLRRTVGVVLTGGVKCVVSVDDCSVLGGGGSNVRVTTDGVG